MGVKDARPRSVLQPVLKLRTGENPHMWQQHACTAPVLVPNHFLPKPGRP